MLVDFKIKHKKSILLFIEKITLEQKYDVERVKK